VIAWVVLVALAAPELTISHRRVDTADGVALALYRYRVGAQPNDSCPILLVPDLGFTRSAFDFEGKGLARALAETGRTVYVVELRGQGKSGPADSLEKLGTIDFPRVLEVIGAPHLDVVVQGWAGSIVLAANADDPRLRKVVALNTPLLAEVPSALAERFLLEGGHFSELGSSPEGRTVFDELFALWAELDPHTRSAFLANGTRDLSRPIANELLAWMRTGDLPLPERSLVTRLSSWKKPTLLLLGLADGFAPPEQCAVWRERAPGPIQLRTFSRVETGDDFAHLSILLGRRAPTMVYPRIIGFLEDR